MKRFILAIACVVFSLQGVHAAEVIDGKALFEKNCVTCHNLDGTATAYGKKLEPFPARDLRAVAPYVPYDELLRIITHGTHKSAMRAKKYDLDPFQIEALVDYIKTFTYTPNLANGKRRFKAVCASCHGSDGRAQTGVGAKNLVYSKLNMPGIVHAIRYGRPGTLMSPKRHQLSNVDIADIANYVYKFRYRGSAKRGEQLYAKNCKSCHATPAKIRVIGNVAVPFKKISDLDDRMLDLRIRHGRHVGRAGKMIRTLSANDVQDVIAYLRKSTR